jgi:hypothetical protein
MKTQNVIIAIAIFIGNMAAQGISYADAKSAKTSAILDVVNETVVSTLDTSFDMNVTLSTAMDGENPSMEKNRDFWEDLVAVPWMIKEVIIRPEKKVNNPKLKVQETTLAVKSK